jgi:hypothetical protein
MMNSSFFKRSMLTIGAGALLCLALPAAHAAEWHWTPIPLGSLTNTTIGSVTNTAAVAFDIPANTPVVFNFTSYGTNTFGSPLLAYRLNLTSDGTNFSNNNPLNFTNAPTGSGTNTSWNVVTAAQLVGAKQGRLDVISTDATNTFTTTRGQMGFFY